MFPQVISIEEVKQAKTIFEEMQIKNVEFGIMVETPAAAILIKDICKEGIDFISFGTNDLTQYTLATDRGNEDVQYIYDEMNWAVLKQISRVIRECKSQGVKTSICGQAGSNPEMVKFLIKQGIDSISVNADVAKQISELVQKLETGENVLEGGNNKMEEKTLDVKTIVEEGNEMGESGALAPTDTSHPENQIEPIDNIESIEERIEEEEKPKDEHAQERLLNPQNPDEEPQERHNPELEKPDEAPKEDKPRKEDIFN